MSERKFLSLFKRSKKEKGVVFSQLDYTETSEKEKSSDLSEVELIQSTAISPLLIANEIRTPQIPIIGIGGSGCKIVGSIVSRLANYEVEFPAMGIDTDKLDLEKVTGVSTKHLIPGSESGTGKQYRIGATLASKNKTKMMDEVKKYLESFELQYDHEIVFLIGGAGGTGVGVMIELCKYLIDMDKRPVPFLILPGREENTRIKFNAAAALYHFTYGPNERALKLTTICIDNEYIFERNSKNSFSTVLSAFNERIAATIGDLLLSTEMDSHGYSADLNEFLEIFREIKSVGVLSFVNGEGNNVTNFFESKQSSSNSMEVDIFSSTRSYFFLQTNRECVSSDDYRSLMLKFNNSDIFPKFHEIQDSSDDRIYRIRGIFTGLRRPSRLENLMQLAEDSRVEVLNQEIAISNSGKSQPKIDRLDGDEEIDVKTGDELARDRSEEYARLRSSGKTHG